MSKNMTKTDFVFSTYGKIGLVAVIILFFIARWFFPAMDVFFWHRHHHTVWGFLLIILVGVPCFLIKDKNIFDLNDKVFKKVGGGDLTVIILFILLAIITFYQVFISFV